MAEGSAAPAESVPATLSTELLQVLTSGDAARLAELLSSHYGRTNDGVPGPGTSYSCLLGATTSNGNTALHLAATRGHAALAALICEQAPSLVAARNTSQLDTPLRGAARGGHRELAARLLSAMHASAGPEAAATMRATNRLGGTALHEAVLHGREEVVDLLVAETPGLASVTSDDGVSPLYLAATAGSVRMVRMLLRPSPDGTASPASSAGRNGRTALHGAAAISKEMVRDILAWKPEGPALLTRADSSGRTPLHFAVREAKLDVVELLLKVDSRQARIRDNNGWYPLHYAAARGCAATTRQSRLLIIDELTKNCPEHCELVDDEGRNFLHVAVAANNDAVVRYVCRDERFAVLLNAMDFEGNTPLHFAVRYGYTSIVSVLLQSTVVEVNATNKDGLTVRDLAHGAFPWGRLQYFLEPAVMIHHCLCWAGACGSLDSIDHLPKEVDDEPAAAALGKSAEKDYTKGTIASALIVSVTFAAAFTVSGGYIADDHPDPGTAVLARRFAFRAFVVSDTLAFLCSILGAGFLVYGGVCDIHPDPAAAGGGGNRRSDDQSYTAKAFALVSVAAESTIAAFAFGLHLALGAANAWLALFMYAAASASVLYFASSTLGHAYGFGKAIWRRAGWKGLLNLHSRRPWGPVEMFWCLCRSPLAKFQGGSLALPMCAVFFVAIALEIALPNY